MKKENTTKTIIRHFLFDNFTHLTYSDKINSLSLILKYSILVSEQDG